MQHTLSLLVRNHPGVMSHVAGLFTRRSYNIESIAVGVTENPELSRMTFVVGGDERIVQQIVKQCQKLVDVLSVKVLKYEESLTRELAVITVKTTSTQSRAEIIQIASVFNARIADMSETSIMIEVTGNQRQINSIISLLAKYGIEEMARTGLVALTFPSMRKPEKPE